MAITVFQDNFKTVTITSNVELPSGHELCLAFLRSIEIINSVIPLSSIRFNPIAGVKTYRYRIIAKDGRVWTQNLIFGTETSDYAEPLMTFSVTSPWFLSEFSKFRSMRDHLVNLFISNAVTDVNCTFV